MSDEILDSLDLIDFKVCVECIKGKQIYVRKLGAKRSSNVLELIYTNICGHSLKLREMANSILLRSLTTIRIIGTFT